jgi:F-type H+-transporting ATPase subunit a
MHSPLEQFKINSLWSLHVGTLNLSFTNTALYMLISCLLVAGFFFLGAQKTQHPGRVQMLAELSYRALINMMKEYLGEHTRQYSPFIITLFCFILCGNLVGLFPYALTFTSQWIINFGLALLVMVLVLVAGFSAHGLKFLSIFMPPDVPWYLAPIMVPVEIISFLSRPLSLSMRLFANMMAGHTMIKVFALFTISLGAYGVLTIAANAALIAFEVVIAFLQAYVFCVLACLYLQDAIHLH